MPIKLRSSCHAWPHYHNAGLHMPALTRSYKAGWKFLSTRSRLYFPELKGGAKDRKSNEIPNVIEEQGERVIHLLRALLRQTSYLPDPASREFFHRHIIASFRRYCNGENGSGEDFSAKRLKQKIVEARKAWKSLVHANHGSPAHLLHVLEMTYGRRGKMKHQLMRDLVGPSSAIPEDSKALEELAWSIGQRHGVSERKEPHLPAKLAALVRSQFNQKDGRFSQTNIKALEPNIPAQNAWLRPLPVKTANNKRRKWYAETLDRVMPPLPEADWMRLKDLSMGELRQEGFPQTRTRAHGQFSSDSYEIKPNPHWHELTPRYMQRMWGRVFLQCPMMQWNEEKRRWYISWGRPYAGTAVAIGTDSDVDDGAFEAVSVKRGFGLTDHRRRS